MVRVENCDSTQTKRENSFYITYTEGRKNKEQTMIFDAAEHQGRMLIWVEHLTALHRGIYKDFLAMRISQLSLDISKNDIMSTDQSFLASESNQLACSNIARV